MWLLLLSWLVSFLWLIEVKGQDLKMKVYRIPLELKSSSFYNIIQDSTGFMLLHTSNGIWSFDGQHFYPIQINIPSRHIIRLTKIGQKNFVLHSEGISEIKYNKSFDFRLESWINCPFPTQIYEEKKNQYWVALQDGRIQNYANQRIQKTYQTTPSKSHFFWQDTSKNFWLFSKEGKLSYHNIKSHQIIPQEIAFDLGQINQVVSKNTQSCWIASSKGIFEFSISAINQKPQINTICSIPNVKNIAFDYHQNCYYIADNQRLSQLKLSNGVYQSVDVLFSNKTQQIDKIPFLNLQQIFFDKDQNIWIIEKNVIASLHPKFFENINAKIPYHPIYAFTEADNGNLYLAMGEFICLEKNIIGKEQILKQLISTENKFFVSVATENQNVWAGTSSGELFVIQKNRTLDKIDLSSRGGSIFYMYADKKKRVWFAQTFRQKELYGVSYTDSTLQVRYYDAQKGLDGRIICVKENKEGKVFCSGIGNLSYLYYLDEQQDKFINLSVTLPFDADGFEVHDFDFDTNQHIWLATTHGLLKYALTSQKIERIDLSKHINQSEIKALKVDKQNRIWLATDHFGLICYDNENSLSFNLEDGIPNYILTYRGLHINQEQKIVVGTLGGIAKSRLPTTGLPPTPKPIVARVMKQKNKLLKPYHIDDYTISIDTELEIELITLSFPSSTVQYQYTLNTLFEGWSYPNNQPRIYLKKLLPGDYYIQIKARQLGYQWSEPFKIRLKILDVWYKRWWAISLWMILVLVVVWIIVQLNTWRLRLDKKRLNVLVEKKTEELQNQNSILKIQQEELLELNEEILSQKRQIEIQKEMIEEKNKHLEDSNFTKDRLFSIIAHDLRAPLNSLISVLDLLKVNRISIEELNEILPILSKDVNYTAELTNNLLYWAVSQMKGETITPKKFELHLIIEENFSLFRQQAQGKGIVLVNQIAESYNLWADMNMINLVVRNLLNNAIKYCQAKDVVTISANPQKETLIICVEDTGRGIKNEMIQRLFKKEVISTKGTAQEKGTGLGLLLCKDFVEKNGGKIWVESEWSKGSRFYFSVPLASN